MTNFSSIFSKLHNLREICSKHPPGTINYVKLYIINLLIINGIPHGKHLFMYRTVIKQIKNKN